MSLTHSHWLSIMKFSLQSTSLFTALSLSATVAGRPAPPQQKRQDSAIVGAPSGPEIDNSNLLYEAVGPVGASGSVYGPQSLRGNAGDKGSATEVGPGVPAKTGPSSNYVGDYTLAPGQEADADLGLYLDLTTNQNPQPIRGSNGATDPGPRNEAIQRQNSDLLARPGTDSGDIANAKWPMGLSSIRSGTGAGTPGWARQQNTDELPAAVAMAGVDMRLGPNAYRELHWHSANEWSYILTGSVRISAVNQNGQTFVDDLQAGDLWYV